MRMTIRRHLQHLLSLLSALVFAAGCSSSSSPGDTPDSSVPTGDRCTEGLGTWTGNGKVDPSTSPPCGLTPEQVPMFVGIGFDDNGDAMGMNWAVDMLADRGHASFFLTSSYMQPLVWKQAFDAGHEVGNHTVSHTTSRTVDAARWQEELTNCNDYLINWTGIPADQIYGFRTPFLEYNDETLTTVKELGFMYDCSIEEGFQWQQDGTNYMWPYTLDNRSPGHTTQVEWGGGLKEIEPHAGLWEMPVYALIVPPDDKCQAYGVPVGFRAKMKTAQDWFDEEGGKITGFDYNLWASTADGGFAVTKDEFVAILKYTFDLRLQGNRAPFLLGAHTDYYVAEWDSNAPNTPAFADRRAAVEEFLDYVKSKPDVRIVSYKEILDWLRKPTAL